MTLIRVRCVRIGLNLNTEIRIMSGMRMKIYIFKKYGRLCHRSKHRERLVDGGGIIDVW